MIPNVALGYFVLLLANVLIPPIRSSRVHGSSTTSSCPKQSDRSGFAVMAPTGMIAVSVGLAAVLAHQERRVSLIQ